MADPNDHKPVTGQRAKQRITHTIDNIGGRDLPHIVVHLQDALRARSPKMMKEHINRALGHAKDASEQSGMLSQAVKVVPGVNKEAKRLNDLRNISDGLVGAPAKGHKPVSKVMFGKRAK